jgi:hypothetical protein
MIRWRNGPIASANAAESSGSSRSKVKVPFKVEFTFAYVAISVTKPRGKSLENREDCNITQGFSFLQREGARSNRADFVIEWMIEEGRPANERYRLGGGYSGYRHSRKPSAALQVTAAVQHIRTVPALISQVYAVHGSCIGMCTEDRFPDIKVRPF